MIEQFNISAEQSVIGSLLLSNDAFDRIPDLEAEHFYRGDHRTVFAEIKRQIGAGARVDAVTLAERLKDRIEDCLKYLIKLHSTAGSASNIEYHAGIVREKAQKRALMALGLELHDLAASPEESAVCADLMGSKLEEISQQKSKFEPKLIGDTMVDYLTMIEKRVAGINKPIPTGYLHFDELMGGGLERGTLTVIAGRPGTGKTAFGLGIARNVAEQGQVSAILSMEMSAAQLNDRNMAAIGRIPLAWLRTPSEGSDDSPYWNQLSFAAQKARDLKMWIDEQAGMNMIELRAKARKIKRQTGLDLMVIDQLSFITGGESEQEWQNIGKYTRGMIEVAKSLDIAVVLLAQLNRKCEDRADKRPIMADLAQSGSIEQDAANIVFLYRDWLYNKQTKEPDIAEIISAKQRQGQPGTIGMKYNGSLTTFENLHYRWERKVAEEKTAKKVGF